MGKARGKSKDCRKIVFGVIKRIEVVHFGGHFGGIASKPIESEIESVASMVHRNATATIFLFTPPMCFPFGNALCMGVSEGVQRNAFYGP